MSIVWQCVRCETVLPGNPRMCPVCDWTVYRPMPKDTPMPAEAKRIADVPAARQHARGELSGVGRDGGVPWTPEFVREQLDAAVEAARGVWQQERLAERERNQRAYAALSDERDEAAALLADVVVKCTEYGEQEGGFVASYIMPTGPIHRAMPWLQDHGVTVRPGFDGRTIKPDLST